MPNRRRSTGPRAAPKLFKCTGYGNCDMVFTRSEHLARHERKHTGEKPYKCVVPGCGRMFSRFDNMMQHTQTHEKNKKMVGSRSTPTSSVSGANPVYRESTPVKSEHQFTDRMPDLITKAPVEHASMIDSRTLPLPTRRASMSSSPYHSSVNDMRLPYPTPFNHHPLYAGDMPRNRSSWPIRREPYPHSFYHQQSYQPYPAHDEYNHIRRRSSTSTLSSESTLVSPVSTAFPQQPHVARRRISIDDLRLPIEHLRDIQLDEKPFKHYNDTVDISPDEFEALEGFSKFHTSSIIGSNAAELTPSPVLQNEPNFSSQVCAMRQRVMSMNESFQRG